MPIIRNCILPDDLYYDVESDLWARFEASGLVTLGLTDVGQSRAGRILVITVRRPVGAEVNDEVLKRPSLMNEGFYGEGWLLRLLGRRKAEELGVLEVPTMVIDGRERIVGVPRDLAALRARLAGARE